MSLPYHHSSAEPENMDPHSFEYAKKRLFRFANAAEQFPRRRLLPEDRESVMQTVTNRFWDLSNTGRSGFPLKSAPSPEEITFASAFVDGDDNYSDNADDESMYYTLDSIVSYFDSCGYEEYAEAVAELMYTEGSRYIRIGDDPKLEGNGLPVFVIELFAATGSRYLPLERDIEELIVDFLTKETERMREFMNSEADESVTDEAVKDVYKASTFINPKTGKRVAQVVTDPSQTVVGDRDAFAKDRRATYFKPERSWKFTDWNGDPEKFVNDKVRPSIEDLSRIRGENLSPEAVLEIVNGLIESLKGLMAGGGSAEGGDGRSGFQLQNDAKEGAEIAEKLKRFKAGLVDITSSAEFMEYMKPILALKRNEKTAKYSFTNCILIYLQDPKATWVLPKGVWESKDGPKGKGFNRVVMPDAKMLWLAMPKSVNISKYGNLRIVREYLKAHGYNDTSELKADERRELELRIRKSFKFSTPKFEYHNYWCDVRFTRPADGFKDEIGDTTGGGKKFSANDVLGNQSERATEQTMKLFDAAIAAAKKNGLTVDMKDKSEFAAGAKGADAYASSDRHITLNKNLERNTAAVHYAIHEIVHSLCHFKWSRFGGAELDRDSMEHEADLTAAMVLYCFGIDITRVSANYALSYGADQERMVKVVDKMAAVVDSVVKDMKSFM